MALYTSNLYGKILVTDEAVRTVVGATALESYGIYGLHGWDAEQPSKKKHPNEKAFKRAVRVDARENRIYIEVNVVLKYGVSVDAVTESLRSAIKYNVELFTGMHVEVININVLGIK